MLQETSAEAILSPLNLFMYVYQTRMDVLLSQAWGAVR